MNNLGLIHVYCGDGKGKTTAAMGLALRAAGSGFRVAIVQFLKNGGSGELKALSSLPGVRVLSGKGVDGFTFSMTEQQKEIVRAVHQAHFEEAVEWCRQGEVELLVLDEAVGASRMGLLDTEALLDFLRKKPEGLEVVLTGREPSDELLCLADYVSEIKKIKHPYDRGIHAREGIER